MIEKITSVNDLFGVAAGTGNNAMITRSVFSGNSTVLRQMPAARLTLNSSSLTGSGTDVQAGDTIRLSNGFRGSAVAYENRRLLGNGTFGSPVSAAGGASSNLGEQ